MWKDELIRFELIEPPLQGNLAGIRERVRSLALPGHWRLQDLNLNTQPAPPNKQVFSASSGIRTRSFR